MKEYIFHPAFRRLNKFSEIRFYMLLILFLAIITSTQAHNRQGSKKNESSLSRSETSVSRGDFDLLPDGTQFPFWDDQTNYTKVFHVAQENPNASDSNPGTLERPYKTINAAAKILQPGEKVIVHEGIYRECIQPARGGTSPERMITYEAAKGEKVVVKGSEVWKPELRPSTGWNMRDTTGQQ